MEYAPITDRGKMRTENEDYHIAEEVGKGYFLAAVADGMGGRRAGKVASRLLLKDILEYMRRGMKSDAIEDVYALFHDVLEKSIRDVYIQSQEPGFQGMGTTLVAALIKGKDALIINIGDSRAYLFSGALTRITEDHSRVQRLLEDKVIKDEEEAFNHPEKNIITRYVGENETVKYDTYNEKIDGVLLLCSDGLSDMLRDREIEEIMGDGESLEKTAELLVEAANKKGGQDNITVVLVRP